MIESSVKVFISLGSNIDPRVNLASARDELFKHLHNATMSPVYQSPAVGMTGADFHNAVVAGSTTQSLTDIITLLSDVEHEHGRVRTANKFSDRTLDLDLLLYGDFVSAPQKSRDTPVDNRHSQHNVTSNIELPHPEILQQAYVAQPLADVAGELVHPVSGLTITELRNQLKSESPELFTVLKVIG